MNIDNAIKKMLGKKDDFDDKEKEEDYEDEEE